MAKLPSGVVGVLVTFSLLSDVRKEQLLGGFTIQEHVRKGVSFSLLSSQYIFPGTDKFCLLIILQHQFHSGSAKTNPDPSVGAIYNYREMKRHYDGYNGFKLCTHADRQQFHLDQGHIIPDLNLLGQLVEARRHQIENECQTLDISVQAARYVFVISSSNRNCANESHSDGEPGIDMRWPRDSLLDSTRKRRMFGVKLNAPELPYLWALAM